jgi:hypothetical protein
METTQTKRNRQENRCIVYLTGPQLKRLKRDACMEDRSISWIMRRIVAAHYQIPAEEKDQAS